MESKRKRGLRTERAVERYLPRKFEVSPRVCSIGTFEERGILTTNRGLVVRSVDGSEYQISIVRSR